MAQDQREGGGGRVEDYEERVVLDTRPCYIKYSLRGLGLFSGAICLLFGILNVILHLGSLSCVFFGILQAVLGFFVATTEAAGGTLQLCYCIFLNKLPKFSGWMERSPLYVKPLFYILAPLVGMIICTTWWTFFGGGMVVLTGVAYIVAYWNQPSNSPKSQDASSPVNNLNNVPPRPHNNNASPHTNNNATANENNLFPRHTVPQPITKKTTPTIIDIRTQQKTTANTTTTTSKSPLKSLANFSNEDVGGRYENISMISGPHPQAPVAINGIGSGGAFDTVDLDGSGGNGPYPDNPFVLDYGKSRPGMNTNEGYNC